MVVRDYMSSQVITIDPQCTIADARRLLRKHRIRQLPVVHKDRLVGIITDRDLRSTSAATKTVGEVMTAKPTVIRPMVPIDEAARVLRKLKVGACRWLITTTSWASSRLRTCWMRLWNSAA
jgi:acetoin utilization protein AcuB